MKLTHTILGILSALAIPAVAGAFSMSSTTYKIDDGVINSFGGSAASTNYGLVSSGGEAFIGPGSSTTYRFDAGYVAQLEHSIALSLDSLTKTIPGVSPGTSQNASSTVAIFTDAAGYLLSARYDGLMTHVTSPSTTVPNVSGTIASPSAWTEGVTKGFGFTITGGTSIEPKWGTNPNYNYAAFTTTDTTIHDKPGYQNTWDNNLIQYRMDVDASQLAGSYRTNVTYSAVVKP